ncbi:degT/DnrJ/EryC1/StrS aminotransferase [Streptomyces bohaiensis]|uniref:DegT/DnrJ/EryC1/StrS aminotransferase n=1 Tax=Streptomyces bohaiensis TaxID=1431344 RepID=A0ABX1C6T7_9ACTN|nr:degT/DnrJ/EryC1/StrS aminotransferase [Streptomyces bohaiensis]NJQ14886.1 degT/DnrJ/EryC1/StrS aminotransferase [Streptomyces bohaiensis]
MEQFDTALVLSRVLTSGVVMSIEKNDKELPALERLLTKRTRRSKAVLVNSRSAAVHAALTGQDIGHGDTAELPAAVTDRDRAFVDWVGVTATAPADGAAPAPAFDLITLTPENAADLATAAADATAPTLVVDLTGLGFGPAAAVLTDDAGVWTRGERLKIFGAFDLRTMWTQQEAEPGLAPGVQFNYRLSPLVAACARMALAQAGTRSAEQTGDTPR